MFTNGGMAGMGNAITTREQFALMFYRFMNR